MSKKNIMDSIDLVQEEHKVQRSNIPETNSFWSIWGGPLKATSGLLGGLLAWYVNTTDTDYVKGKTLDYMVEWTSNKKATTLFLEDNPQLVQDVYTGKETTDMRLLEELLYEPSKEVTRSIFHIGREKVTRGNSDDSKLFLRGKFIATHENFSSLTHHFPNHNLIHDYDFHVLYEIQKDTKKAKRLEGQIVSVQEGRDDIYLMDVHGTVKSYEGNDVYEIKEHRSEFSFLKKIHGTDLVVAMNQDNEYKILNKEEGDALDVEKKLNTLIKYLKQEHTHIGSSEELVYHDETLYYREHSLEKLHVVHDEKRKLYDAERIVDVGLYHYENDYPGTERIIFEMENDDIYSIQAFSQNTTVGFQFISKKVDFDELEHTRWLQPQDFRSQFYQDYKK